MYRLVDFMYGLVIGVFIVSLVYSFFFILPVSLATEKKCLEAGYPEYRVTWDLDQYCLNLTGDVSVKVEELE